MPYDRRSRRALLALMGLVGVAVSVGCARSSNLRTAAGSLPELAPAGALRPDGDIAATAAGGSSASSVAMTSSGAAGRTTTAPFSQPSLDSSLVPAGTSAGPNAVAAPATTPPYDSPAPTAIDAGTSGDGNGKAGPAVAPAQATDSMPGAGSAATPALDGTLQSPPGTTTPLLDADLRRARAITRQHFESLSAIRRPTPAAEPVNPPPASGRPTLLETTPGDSDSDLVAPLPPLAASAAPLVEIEASSSTAKMALPTLVPIDTAAGSEPAPGPVPPERGAPAAEPRPPIVEPVASAPADADRPIGPVAPADAPPADPPTASEPATTIGNPRPAPIPAPDEPTPLEIADLKLCTRVRKFGEYDAIDHQRVPAGRLLIVYCEMGGLQYQRRGDVFISRLSTHIELRSGSDGPVVWEMAPAVAEDTCRRSRHDYHVSYFIELPRSLDPGPYRLRVIQTDMIGVHAQTREIPITIVRSTSPTPAD